MHWENHNNIIKLPHFALRKKRKGVKGKAIRKLEIFENGWV
jgi:hypothetical protein